MNSVANILYHHTIRFNKLCNINLDIYQKKKKIKYCDNRILVQTIKINII